MRCTLIFNSPCLIHFELVHAALISRLSLQCDNNSTIVPSAPAALVSVLVQIYSLPSPQGKATILDWYVETHTHQRRLNMARHIIVAFHCVEKCPVPIPACRHYFIECNLHVSAYVWVGILVY
mmetsp:Transcript_18012/g.40713  ORF Transcript_18012/g.40713 Transcript_18012/m.40713 type:complete len:123 (-) Transcript_18012:396-764(-)